LFERKATQLAELSGESHGERSYKEKVDRLGTVWIARAVFYLEEKYG